MTLHLFCIVTRWALRNTDAITENTYHVGEVSGIYLGNHVCTGALGPVKVWIVFCGVRISTSVRVTVPSDEKNPRVTSFPTICSCNYHPKAEQSEGYYTWQISNGPQFCRACRQVFGKFQFCNLNNYVEIKLTSYKSLAERFFGVSGAFSGIVSISVILI